VVDFKLLPFSSQLSILAEGDPRLHQLHVGVKVLTPLPDLGLALELYGFPLLQSVIIFVIFKVQSKLVKILINLDSEDPHRFGLVTRNFRLDHLELVLTISQILLDFLVL
jgi:hypothetical protein